jgi:hypothetical protein
MVASCELWRTWAAQLLWPCPLQPTWPFSGFLHLSVGSRHFTFLAFLTSWGITVLSVPPSQLHALSLRGCLQGFWSCHTLPGFPGLPLKTGWKPPDPIILTFCVPAKPASCGWGAAVASECLGDWAWWTESWGAGSPFSSQGKVFRRSLLFHPLKPALGGVWPIPKMPSRHLPYCPDEKSFASF